MNKDIDYIIKFMDNELKNIQKDKRLDELFKYCFIKYSYSKENWDKQLKDFEKLRTYYKEIPENEYFNSNKKTQGDGDRTKIVYAMYRLLWENLNFNYDGETLNTRDNICNINNKKIENRSQEIMDSAENFRIIYETIGNFMPLPTNGGFKGLNCAKNRVYFDQFDLCLEEIKRFYTNQHIEQNAYGYAIRINKEYFGLFNNFSDFLEKNYLQDYVEDFDNGDYTIKKLFIREEYQVLPESDQQILDYFQNATKVIENRADRMKNELINKYKNELNGYYKDKDQI